ncbi:hypothetical protein [Spartinivicinus ruber]|uniref:hypothetical protein n=1 Tax=Spartinivicinus ruber TaxID=2683272 RepID=UPI0013CFCF94|nr:hypothetical protein [Spartinivicinus ruber]
MNVILLNKRFALKRRQLLKVGIAGSLALSGVITINQLANNSSDRSAIGYQFLSAGDVGFFSAVAPVILGVSKNKSELITAELKAGNEYWRSTQQNAFLKQLDAKLAFLSPALQKELRELLGLVNLSLTQWLITGVRGSWENATNDEIASFLQRWQTSSISLLRKAHHALTQLCIMVWYSLPINWSNIGYPGVPFKKVLITPVNHF